MEEAKKEPEEKKVCPQCRKEVSRLFRTWVGVVCCAACLIEPAPRARDCITR